MGENVSSGRRKFFATLAMGGIAAAAVTQSSEQAGQAPLKQLQRGKGYQLTEHVRNYYRTART